MLMLIKASAFSAFVLNLTTWNLFSSILLNILSLFSVSFNIIQVY